MSQKVNIIFLLIILPIACIGQNTIGGNDTKGMDMNSFPYGTIAEVGFISPRTLGSSYLVDNWLIGDIYLLDEQSIEGYPIKIDLENDLIEIKTDKGIKVLPGARVERVGWFNSFANKQELFVNGALFSEEGVLSSGFYEVLEQGEWSLLNKHYAVLVEGKYVPALDAGDPDHKIVKKSDFYLLKGKDLIKLPRSLKRISKLFGDREEEIYNFLRSKRINVKDEEGLKQLFKYLNQTS